MCSGKSTRALPRVGFPIRKSRDQRLVSTSPGLFAAGHVLLRLLAPRHPPRALRLLIVKNTVLCRYGVFKVRAGTRPARATPHRRGPSKLNSVIASRSTFFQASRVTGRAEAHHGPDAYGSWSSRIP